MIRSSVFKVLLIVTIAIVCFATVSSGAGIPVNAGVSADIESGAYDSVVFNSGKHKLVGKLITRAKPGTKVPVIIFAVGSGTSSYRTNYKSFLKFFFEDNLPLDSVALFYFDKRGIGSSDGNWSTADFKERAEDVKAAADYLGSLPFIDGGRIVVAGHSQGGWIAQICAAKYPETFSAGISMAGPTFTVRKQLVNDYRSRYICSGMDTSKADVVAAKKVRSLFKMASLLPVNPQLKQLKVIRKFEAAPYISSIRSPFLFMFGENDALVSPDWSYQELNRLFENTLPGNFKALTIDGVNHSFQHALLCPAPVKVAKKYSTTAQLAVSEWARSILLVRSRAEKPELP